MFTTRYWQRVLRTGTKRLQLVDTARPGQTSQPTSEEDNTVRLLSTPFSALPKQCGSSTVQQLLHPSSQFTTSRHRLFLFFLPRLSTRAWHLDLEEILTLHIDLLHHRELLLIFHLYKALHSPQAPLALISISSSIVGIFPFLSPSFSPSHRDTHPTGRELRPSSLSILVVHCDFPRL